MSFPDPLDDAIPDYFGEGSGVLLRGGSSPEVNAYWHQRFGYLQMRPADLAERLRVGMPGEAKVVFEAVDPMRDAVVIALDLGDAQGRIFFTQQSLIFDVGMLHLDLVQVDEARQRQGKGRRLTRNAFNLAKDLDLQRLGVHAVDVGTYKWAKVGFAPTVESWNSSTCKGAIGGAIASIKSLDTRILNRVFFALSKEDPKAIWEIADLEMKVRTTTNETPVKLGQHLLTKSGASWRGTLELSDANQVERASNYFGNAD
jgi:predicted N-acetyltransferase YhbS